ncbi:MAG: hypothetical protein HFJ79_05930 [Clostridiales bacterium]|nr:hypothetical protein [Clostridiales bacterium]
MSINTLSFAEKMTAEMDQAIVQKPVTGFLADNVMRSKFIGAQTVLVPELEVSGLGDYDRDSGFVKGAVTVGSKPYTLTMDRGRSFQLDSEDNDETGIAGLAGQVLGEFVRTQVVPEIDAYNLSKLSALAYGKSQTVTGTPATQAYKMFIDAVGKVQNAVGYDEELVAFVDGKMWAAFQSSAELTRQIAVSDFRRGEVTVSVRSINSVALLPVPDSRMKTAFTFHDGTTSGEEGGGFAPASGAKSVGLLVMPRRGASLVKKTEKIRVFEPEKNPAADAWKFDYRLYYDLLVRASFEESIYTYVY